MINLNKNNFESETKEGLIILDFWAVWCSPCKALEPILRRDFDKIIKIGKIDIDSEQDLAVKFHVKAIPTIIILHNGIERKRFVGNQNMGLIMKFIKEIGNISQLK